MHIQPFIFNWRGQFDKVVATEKHLRNISAEPIVINSDVHHTCPTWINIGDNAYFTDQFVKAIELFNGDVLFHIQGDATYHDWRGIITNAVKYFPVYQWGIFAPNVDYTFHDASRVDMECL